MTNTSSDAETSFQQAVEALSLSTLNLAIKSHYTLQLQYYQNKCGGKHHVSV